MRLRATALLLPVVLGAIAVLPITAATTPAIQAKQAQAARVLHQIAAIDEQLSVITERFDGARYRLGVLRGQLRKEQASLAVARTQNRTAQQHVAKLLVTLYESGRPSALEAMLGARSISELLSIYDAEAAISRQDAAIAAAAIEARRRLEQRVRVLELDRAAAVAAVAELRKERAQIEGGLARRRALLASVQAEVVRLEVQERARQARLAALARARLEAEARARQQALAAARARAVRVRAEATAREKAARKLREIARAAAEPPALSPAAPLTPASATTTTDAPATTTAADSIGTSSAPVFPATTPSPPAAPVPLTVLPEGHPQAATIALNYLGVPYLWGGGTPAGFDCSGLVSYVFAQIGIPLPHYAVAQWSSGVPVQLAQLQPGDLVFFDHLDHVGIYIGANQFVHAPHSGTAVRIDSLSDSWYSTHYIGARRI